MPVTAPLVTGTVTRLQISLRLVDRSGDLRAVSINTTNVSLTDAQIQAYVNALGALTQAAVYGVSIERLYLTNPDRDAAVRGPHDSVYDNIVTLVKNLSQINGAVSAFIPAPISGLLVDDTDTPNVGLPAYEIYTDALEVVMGAGWSDESTRFTERREKNERVIN